ncbi:MAG: ROK family protein [bacterium]|nr:ROK family protein [bacterium]
MYLTIDIGGTKTLIGLMTKTGKIVNSLKFPTPPDYDEFKHQLAENIAKVTTTPFTIACSSAPARIDHDTGIALAFGNLKWENVPIRDDIRKITRTPVLLENDTKLAGLSEARLLIPPRNKVLYITISTGIGSVLVVDNKIDPDLRDSEVGHMVFERKGELVPWESFASGKAIVKRFGKRASDIDDPLTWEIISKDIAIGLIDVIANVQPDIVIFGGGVGSHFKKFKKPLMRELKKYESPLVPIPDIVGAINPEEAVIYGCYEMIKDYEKQL